MDDVTALKAQIRSVLLSCGKTATEQEFRKAFYELEGVSFNTILTKYRMNFYDLFHQLPDVVRVVYSRNLIFLQRISTESTAHMDSLSINKYSKNYKGPKLVTKSGAIKGRQGTAPASFKVNALPFYLNPSRDSYYWSNTQTKGKESPQQNYNGYVNGSQNHYQGSSYTQKVTPNIQAPPKSKFDFHSSKNAGTQSNPGTQNGSKVLPSVSSSSSTPIYMMPKKPFSLMELKNDCSKQRVYTQPPTINNKENYEKDCMKKNNIEISVDLTKLTKYSKDNVMEIVGSKTIDTSKTNAITKQLENLHLDCMKKNDSAITVIDLVTPPKKETYAMDNFSERTNGETKNTFENSSKEAIEPYLDTKILNPDTIRNRLRSMRLFREALQNINIKNEDDSLEKKQNDKITNTLVQIPQPIRNEQELFFQIKIIDILSPSNFTFQFSLEKSVELSKALNKFYSELKDVENYRVKDMIMDNVVAVRSNNFWYRGQIKSINQVKSKAFVYNVDCIKIQAEEVSFETIYHLHQKFTTESPKSAFGRLYGLKSKGAKWDVSSISKLVEIQNKVVLAMVKNLKNEIYSLSIISDIKNGIRISDKFLAEGLAEIDGDDLSVAPVCHSLV